jgi:hypothetical protein
MAFQLVLNGPSQDRELDLQTKFNYNANQSIDSISISGNTLTLGRFGGGSISAQLPIAPNRIITGMVSTTTGFTLNTTAGTYQINNNSFTIGAFTGVIPAAHATLNRIDILVVNNLGAYVYKTGTAAANPATPVILANELLITQINIPAAGIPNQGNGFYTLPQGTVDGAILTWDTGTTQWIETPNNRVTNLTSFLEVSNSANIQVGTLPNASYLNMNTNNAKLGAQFGASHFAEINVISGGIEITSNGTGSQPVVFDVDQGITILPNVPVSNTTKLYNNAGGLYWSGNRLDNVQNGTIPSQLLNWDNLNQIWEKNNNHFLIASSASFGDVIRTTSGSVTNMFSASCEDFDFVGINMGAITQSAMVASKGSDQTTDVGNNCSLAFNVTLASLNSHIKTPFNLCDAKHNAVIAAENSSIQNLATNTSVRFSMITGDVGILKRSYTFRCKNIEIMGGEVLGNRLDVSAGGTVTLNNSHRIVTGDFFASGGVTLNLPSTPIDGQKLTIICVVPSAGGITLMGNGNQICDTAGCASSIVINAAYKVRELIFIGDPYNKWVILN